VHGAHRVAIGVGGERGGRRTSAHVPCPSSSLSTGHSFDEEEEAEEEEEVPSARRVSLSLAAFFIIENISPFTAHTGLSQSASLAAFPASLDDPAMRRAHSSLLARSAARDTLFRQKKMSSEEKKKRLDIKPLTQNLKL
jgi:hypothetical protein